MRHALHPKSWQSLGLGLFAMGILLSSVVQGIPSFFVPQAEAATTVVTPGSLSDWRFQFNGTASGSFVNGPATPPMGVGSLKLMVGSDGNSGSQFRNSAYNNTPLTSLTSLRYSTYVQNFTNCQAPYLIFNVDNDNNGSIDDTLFFEPCYQTGTYTGSTVPNQGNVTLNTWQEWNALTGGWWPSSEGNGGPPLRTLAAYAASHPNARIVNSTTGSGGVRITAGFGAGAWDNFIGYADAFTIGISGNETTYDFEAGNASSSSSSTVSSTESSMSSLTSSSSLSSTTSSSTMSLSSSSSSTACDPFADAVTSFNQADQKNGTDVAANRSNPAKALGSPNTAGAPVFVSLGFSGSITLGFNNTIVNGTGADVRIYESSLALNYPLERARVFASQDGSTWTELGFADSSDNCNCEQNTTDLDLGPLGSAKFIRLVDATNPALHASDADAFDLNAIEALNNSCAASSSLSSLSSSLSSMSSSLSMSSASSVSSSSSSLMAGVPTCNGMTATVYVHANGRIVGGPDNGEEFDEVLRGTMGNDIIVGTSDDDRIYGRSGNDTICGGAGDDEIDAGSGDDKIAGEAGEDELEGENGQDLVCGQEDDDDLDGGNAPDQLDAGSGDDDIDGGNGSDTCRNGEDNDDCESSGGGSIAQCSILRSNVVHSSSSSNPL